MVVENKMIEVGLENPNLDFLLSQIARMEKETFSDAWSKESLLETMKNPQATIFAEESMADAEDSNGGLNGYLILYFVLDECEIARIAVDEKQRRRGVGHRLMEKLKSWSGENHMSRILLDVRESNESAISFYIKEGFQVDGKRKRFYEKPQEDAVLMSVTSC